MREGRAGPSPVRVRSTPHSADLSLSVGAHARINLSGVIALAFFLSGATGLMYELVWLRMLGLIFGHTAHAITTVLVVFMGGLALGSFLCGRRVDGVRALLQTYAWLEITIGVYGLLTPWLIGAVQGAYVAYARAFHPSFEVLTAVQFALSTAVLLAPASLMGATLPVLSRYMIRERSAVGRRVGSLYAWNTFGAVLGTYLVGFHLLPAFGMRITLLGTSLLNIAIGVGVLLAARAWGESAPIPSPAPQGRSSEAMPVLVPGSRILMLGAAASGAIAMIYELSWTRALTMVIGSTTYAFSAMLLSFLIGIAGGSAWAARRASRTPAGPGLFASLQIAAALLSLGVLAVFDYLPDVFLVGFRMSQEPGFIVWLQIALSIAVMILPAFCLGAALPSVIHVLCAGLPRVGHSVGRVYACNTAGAIGGSFAAGFVLIPQLGVQTTIRGAIVVNVLIGLAVVLTLNARLRWAASGATLAGALGATALPNWDLAVMSSGVSTYAHYYSGGGGPWRERIDEEVLFYQDGVGATVSVHQGEDGRSLRVNGKTDASTGIDMATQLMIGHLPALMHPTPKSALVIGLGSGVTVGALTQYELDRIDVVEIEPAVVEASSFFLDENRHALSDPRVRAIVADGRNYLFLSPTRYDLIVSQPSNPWIGGIATLFTVEFFELARSRLAEGGVMALWIQAYAIAPEDLRMIAATFRAVFPFLSLWSPVAGDLILIGTAQPQVVDLGHIRNMYASHPGIRADFAISNLPSPEALLSAFHLDDGGLARLTAGVALNTDDRLPLEFSAPRSLYRDTLALNYEMLERVRGVGPLR
jgi:spermidine synthase